MFALLAYQQRHYSRSHASEQRVALEQPKAELCGARYLAMQSEHGYLRAHVESHSEQVPHATTDVHPALSSQSKLA
jgi:hypothetical protein